MLKPNCTLGALAWVHARRGAPPTALLRRTPPPPCRKDTGEILGVHLMGLHAADLIHEASNAMATKQRVQVRGRRGAAWGSC